MIRLVPLATSLTTEDLDYALPDDLIAQHPPERRGDSRLMVLDAGVGEPRAITTFGAEDGFLAQLRPTDLVVANDSRVLNARVRVQRETGGQGELLLLAPADTQPARDTGRCRWIAMARPARKYRPGATVMTMLGSAEVTTVQREAEHSQTWVIELPVALDDTPGWLLAHGELPLPPYVTERGQEPERYQTVHARLDGSVAAPTAGLHFDRDLWAAVRAKCEVAHVTLHVGAGTFLPVSDGPLTEHVMHHERFEVPPATDIAIRAALSAGRRIVAIGTTSTRVLETVYAQPEATRQLHGSTDLFIVPGRPWSCVGALLTNFHLPKSTLIALVMAFHGIEPTRATYAAAMRERLRFYSFGDAMFVHGPPVDAAG
ncbi:MAG: tRNA preQ1(34) S-adenosylmethionine ribosyltransferase-isomerase QueA [Thermoleophilia bacterium]|nr:tRNA preQ1(34) S-adenosylmethionine ribosyltransferase-isomerase QueA [Thermoleophilia bacterium]